MDLKLKPFGKFFNRHWQKTRHHFRRLVKSVQNRYQELNEAAARQAAAPSPNAVKAETDTLMFEAKRFIAAGDLIAAEDKFLAAIKLDSKAVEAYRGLGRIYFEQGKLKQAKEVYEFILKLSPDDDRAYNRLGRLALASSEWERAAKYLEVAVKLNNQRAVRFFDLGRAYQALKKPAAALRNFAKAVQLEPNNAKYLDQLLEMSIIAGDSDLAQETYERLRLANPDNKKLSEFKQRIEEIVT